MLLSHVILSSLFWIGKIIQELCITDTERHFLDFQGLILQPDSVLVGFGGSWERDLGFFEDKPISKKEKIHSETLTYM